MPLALFPFTIMYMYVYKYPTDGSNMNMFILCTSHAASCCINPKFKQRLDPFQITIRNLSHPWKWVDTGPKHLQHIDPINKFVLIVIMKCMSLVIMTVLNTLTRSLLRRILHSHKGALMTHCYTTRLWITSIFLNDFNWDHFANNALYTSA
jgi:hypothetical protein